MIRYPIPHITLLGVYPMSANAEISYSNSPHEDLFIVYIRSIMFSRGICTIMFFVRGGLGENLYVSRYGVYVG